MAFPEGWGRRCALTIESDEVDADLSDFPVLFTPDNLPAEMLDADGTDPALSDGGDVRFSSDAEGTNQLPCEIVAFATNNNPAAATAEIWVKVPTVSSSADTTVYVWYSKSGESQPAAGDTYGRNAVWNDDYFAVYHCAEDPSGSAPQMIDSTGNGNDGTSNGSMVSGDLVSAKIGNGLAFASGQSVSLTNEWIGNETQVTFEGWTQLNNQVNGSDFIDAGLPMAMSFNGLGRTYLNARANTGFSGRLIEVASPTVPDDGTWVHVSGVVDCDNDEHFVYHDGAQVGTSTQALDALDEGSDNANTHFGGGTLDAQVDEIRISLTARSAAWIAAGVTNQDAPGTFASAGTPETPSSGIAGNGSVSTAAATAAGTAEYTPPPIAGSGAVEAGAAIAAGTADYTPPPIEGAGTVFAAAAIAAGSAEHTPPPIEGSGAVEAGAATAAGTADYTPPPIEGAGTVSAAAAIAAGSAEHTPPPIEGSGAVETGAATAAGTATFTEAGGEAATLLEDLHAFLSTRAALTDIVGDRIRPGQLAENDDLPAVTFAIDRQTRNADLEGQCGLVNAEISVACISRDVVEAWNIAEAVRTNGTDPGTGLAGFRGTAGSRTICAVHGDDTYEANDPDDESDEPWHVAISEYTVTFNEAVGAGRNADPPAAGTATLLEDIRTFLAGLPTVAAVVGDRIRPGLLGESDDLPAIVFAIEQQERQTDLEGVAGLVRAQVAIGCISRDVVEAWQLHEAVRTNGTDPGTGLAGFRGTAGSRTIVATHGDDDYATNDTDDESDEPWHSAIGLYDIEFNETT